MLVWPAATWTSSAVQRRSLDASLVTMVRYMVRRHRHQYESWIDYHKATFRFCRDWFHQHHFKMISAIVQTRKRTWCQMISTKARYAHVRRLLLWRNREWQTVHEIADEPRPTRANRGRPRMRWENDFVRHFGENWSKREDIWDAPALAFVEATARR